MHRYPAFVLALSAATALAQPPAAAQPEPQLDLQPDLQPAPVESPNYAALRNARLETIPDAERAWPLYAQIQAILAPHARTFRTIQGAAPGSSNWPDATALLDSIPTLLPLVEQLQSRPELAWPWTDALPAEWVHTVRGPDAPVGDPSPHPLLSKILLPYVGTIQTAAECVRMEALRAAEQGNSQRAVEILELIPPMVRHLGETRVANTAVGAITVQNTTLVQGVLQLTSLYGDAFSAEDLDRLDGLLAAVTHQKFSPDIIADEETLFADVIDTIYNEFDPLGEPQISVRGAGLLMQLSGSAIPPDLDPDSDMPEESKKTGIARFRTIALSYDETTMGWQRAWDAAAAESSEPVWTWDGRPSLAMLREESSAAAESGRALPHLLFVGSFGRIAELSELLHVRTQAARLAVALQRYHNQTGTWPDALDALVPDTIDAIPADWVDGSPLRYLPSQDDNPDAKPTIYSIGPDGDDDDAKALPPGAGEHYIYPAQREANPDAIPDGDWILWP
ncbi:MAG: hypothetical protein Q9O74_08935 [Planctomycetota bacterium]|nr:hypothetical protein [Planctomycetota bacterium]